MREFIPDKAIKPGAKKSTQKRNDSRNVTASNLSENRSGTGAGYRPAQAKNQSAEYIPPMEGFVFYAYGFTVEGFCPKLFQDENRDHRHKNGKPDNAIHVKGLEAEHFLNSEPAHHFGFDEDNAESHSEEQIFKPFHSDKRKGNRNQLVKIPPSIKQQVATNDGHCNVEMPIMA